MLVWKFLQGDEDGLQISTCEKYKWLTNAQSLAKTIEDQYGLLNEMNNTNSTYFSKSLGTKETIPINGFNNWVGVNRNNLEYIKQIHDNEDGSVTLSDLEKNHVYICKETTSEFSGTDWFTTMYIYAFKDKPVLSNYKIHMLSEYSKNSRVKVLYKDCFHGDAFICFFDENGALEVVFQLGYSNGGKSNAIFWRDYLLRSKNWTVEPLPEQPSGHYIVYKDDANEREDASKDYAVKNSIIIPQGTEVTVLEDAVTKKNVNVSKIKEVDRDQEHWTTKTNIKEIISLTETGATESMELEWSVFCRQLPYSNDTTSVRPEKDLACTKIATCGDYFRIASPSLEEFGTSNNSKGYWIYDWQEIQTMTPGEIAIIRNQIRAITNAETRGNYFESLQYKVPYHNQRNNTSTLTKYTGVAVNIGDVMCNVTSQAMALEMLGKSNPCTDLDQFEDCLESNITKTHTGTFNFQPLNDGHSYDNSREWADGRNSAIVNLYGSNITREDTTCYMKKDAEKAKNYIKKKLRQGDGVIVSFNGHFIRIVACDDDGYTYDDPYGTYTVKSDGKRNWTSYNTKTEESGCGYHNSRAWSDFDILTRDVKFFIEVYHENN